MGGKQSKQFNTEEVQPEIERVRALRAKHSVLETEIKSKYQDDNLQQRLQNEMLMIGANYKDNPKVLKEKLQNYRGSLIEQDDIYQRIMKKNNPIQIQTEERAIYLNILVEKMVEIVQKDYTLFETEFQKQMQNISRFIVENHVKIVLASGLLCFLIGITTGYSPFMIAGVLIIVAVGIIVFKQSDYKIKF